ATLGVARVRQHATTADVTHPQPDYGYGVLAWGRADLEVVVGDHGRVLDVRHLVVADLRVVGPRGRVEGVVHALGLRQRGGDAVHVERSGAAGQPQPLHQQWEAGHVVGVFVRHDERRHAVEVETADQHALGGVAAAVDHDQRIAPFEREHRRRALLTGERGAGSE